MLWECLFSKCWVAFFSKLSTLSHLFQNIFISEKLYDTRLLWVWLPAKSPLSLQYLITSPKNDTNVENCDLKSCAYCNPFFSKVEQQSQSKVFGQVEWKHFCVYINSHFLRPQLVTLVLPTFHEFLISCQEHSSWKLSPIGFMTACIARWPMWHGYRCNSTTAASPPWSLLSTKLLRSAAWATSHLFCALDTSVVHVHCIDPVDLREFRHVPVFVQQSRYSVV